MAREEILMVRDHDVRERVGQHPGDTVDDWKHACALAAAHHSLFDVFGTLGVERLRVKVAAALTPWTAEPLQKGRPHATNLVMKRRQSGN